MDDFKPPTADANTLWYLSSVFILGSLSSIAALLGDKAAIVDSRAIAAYVIAGAMAALGIVLVLSNWYGFNYFLLGVSIFAGHTAVQVLALGSRLVSNLLKTRVGDVTKKDA